MTFLNGLDLNYLPLMMKLGLGWRDQNDHDIENIMSFFAQNGANCIRVRIWVGSSGPSRLPYAFKLAQLAEGADLGIQPTIFLSDRWADLYKQPEPALWVSMSFQNKLKAIEKYVSTVVRKFSSLETRCEYYQIGAESDYGICGIFAHDKKKRKNLEWLKEHVWKHEATILGRSIETIRKLDKEGQIALHLGKWWDQNLVESFLSTMDEFNLHYDIVCFSFYPTMFGANIEHVKLLAEVARRSGKRITIGEYAYPSGPLYGQFWYMNKPTQGYPLTSHGQASFVSDFLILCKQVGIQGAFYWSPELYLTKEHKEKFPGPKEMPLSFGWGPMSFFDEEGRARPCVDSLKI